MDADGLAGAELASAAFGAEVGDAELAAADLVADGVGLAEVAHGAAKDTAGAGEGRAAGQRRGVGVGPDFEGRGGVRRAPAVAGRRRGVAVAHRRRGGEFEFGLFSGKANVGGGRTRVVDGGLTYFMKCLKHPYINVQWDYH